MLSVSLTQTVSLFQAFWEWVEVGIRKAEMSLGIQLNYSQIQQRSEGSPLEKPEILDEMQHRLLHFCSDRSYGGVFTSVYDPALIPAIQLCVDNGIPIVTINSGYDGGPAVPDLLHHIGSVETEMGRAAAAELFAKLGDDGGMRYAVCAIHGGAIGLLSMQHRCDAFEQELNRLNPAIIVSRLEDEFDELDIWTHLGVESGADGVGLLLNSPSTQLARAMELKDESPGLTVGTFDSTHEASEMIRAGKLHFVIDQQQFLQGHLAVALLTVNAYTGHHLEDVLLETGRLFGKNPREVASVACLENAFKRCYEQAIAPAQPPPPTVVSSDSTGWIVWAVVASIALAGCAVVFRWGWKKNEKLAKTRREQDEIKEHERESRAHVLAHDKHMDAIEGEAQPDEQKAGILRNASAKRFGHKALRARSRRQIAERLDEEEKKRLLETCSLFRRCSVEQLTKFAERLDQRDYDNEAPVITAGDFADCMFIVASGTCMAQAGAPHDTTSSGHRTISIEPKPYVVEDIFGEDALFAEKGARFGNNVIARAVSGLSDRTVCLVMKRSDYHEVQDAIEAAGEGDSELDDAYYTKFGGWVGSFGKTGDFYAGLQDIIGDCSPRLLETMRAEHRDVGEMHDGLPAYGASDTTFTSSNYGVETCPRDEWAFVAEQGSTMPGGTDPDTGSPLPEREWVSPVELHAKAARWISSRLQESIARNPELANQDKLITEDMVEKDLRDDPLLLEEIIGLRLYTGPMFDLYNGVLRAWGNVSRRGYTRKGSGVSPDHSLSVKHAFTTTLHVINSGLLKLSRIQPAVRIYRGMSGVKLPPSFIESDDYKCVRGGVEYGFMSFSTESSVAERYARLGDNASSSTVIEAEMGLVDRGAALDWLSQYPEEREICFPALTALSVVSVESVAASEDGLSRTTKASAGGVKRFVVRLNCNLTSQTIESLLGQRKRQVAELVELVQNDVDTAHQDRDIIQKRDQILKLKSEVANAHRDEFNANFFLTKMVDQIVAQLPHNGDEVQDLDANNSRSAVMDLVQLDENGSFASCSEDGTLQRFFISKLGTDGYRPKGSVQLESGSLCLAHQAEPFCLVAGLFDGDLPTFRSADLWAQSVFGSGSGAKLLKMDSRDKVMKVSEQFDQKRAVTALAIRAGDGLLAVGTNMGQIELHQWRDEMNGWNRTAIEWVHREAVQQLLWIQDQAGSTTLVSGSLDKQILGRRLLETGAHGAHDMEKPSRYEGGDDRDAVYAAHESPVTALADLGSGKFASGAANGAIRIWCSSRKEVERSIHLNAGGVTCLQWLPQHGWLASGVKQRHFLDLFAVRLANPGKHRYCSTARRPRSC